MPPQFTPAALVNKSGVFGAVHSAGDCRAAATRLLIRALLRLEESSKRDAFLMLNPRLDSGQHLGDLRRVHELADELESYLATFSADFKSPSSHRPTRE
ncbi:hypothetical protein FOZ60_008054 [Perkinsus olseni]|uniref:Uncharacterized protein n=1 Tax=Perkinsus olseni TaxID=32597 RepID=A0A7J6PEW9_PEROL|nr:hypothetical protein FOZ60_008054 [Perkinsus olseni]